MRDVIILREEKKSANEIIRIEDWRDRYPFLTKGVVVAAEYKILEKASRLAGSRQKKRLVRDVYECNDVEEAVSLCNELLSGTLAFEEAHKRYYALCDSQ